MLPKEGKDQSGSAQTWSGNRMFLWYQMEDFKAIMGRNIRVKRDRTLSERHRAAGYCGCTEVLAKLPNIFLGLEKSCLSFKLSNHFLGSSQGCANALLQPNPFLDLLGFYALILSNLFFRFSQASLFPLLITILASTVHVLSERKE